MLKLRYLIYGVLTLLVLVIILPISYAYGTPVQNLSLIGIDDSFSGASINLEFSEDDLVRNVIVPKLEKGFLQIFDEEFEIINPKIKSVGNSFSIKSLEEDYKIVIYGHQLNDENFLLKTIFVDGNFIQKFSFLSSELKSDEDETIHEIVNDRLAIANKQTFSVFWSQEYRIFVKIFENSINPFGNYDKVNGVIEGIDVSIEITNPLGKSYKQIQGLKAANGIFSEKFVVDALSSIPGKYTVQILATDGVNTVTDEVFFFVFQDQSTD